MTSQKNKELELCSGYEHVSYQQPSRVFDYRFKESLEAQLDLGEYRPFATHICTSDFMFQLSVFKYLFKNYRTFQEDLDKLKNYLITWEKCITGHQTKSGTHCYNHSFRDLMERSFKLIKLKISKLENFTSKDFIDLEKSLNYGRLWNELQSTITKTFYAHLTIFPKWLNINPPNEPRRGTCAECKEFDIIGPPVPRFIGLSAFFMPYETKLPNGVTVPEGILLHEAAGAFHELHEHAHAYLHEKKKGHQHPKCDWIEEGISDWAAIQILKPRSKERSFYLEVYDFWIILNSMDSAARKKLIQCWCIEPEQFRWQKFVSDMRKYLKDHKVQFRSKLAWKPNESCDCELNIEKYFY